ncbi:MAG: ATP-binding protein [Eubacteriales bacterium]|nr:ATP-binding protein [Eubacteriales bacterium]
MRFTELSHDMLVNRCDPEIFKFSDTSEVEPSNEVIGQERAVRAMEFGLRIRMEGYNIYISGTKGTGKTNYAENHIKKVAVKEKTPDDWCYVYNFDNPSQPVAINLTAGKGRQFQKDMHEFAKVLSDEITRAFDNEEFLKEKQTISKKYQKQKEKLLNRLNAEAGKYDFKVKTTTSGIYFLPVVEGKAVSLQEYGELDENLKSEISKKSEVVHEETADIIRNIRTIEKTEQENIAKWESKITLLTIGTSIDDLKKKYKRNKKITAYLEKVQQDILANLDDFKEPEPSEEQSVFPWMGKAAEEPESKYYVNLVVDNGSLRGAPVITDYNPTYYNLMGKVEYENEFGTMTTDYTMIKPGLFHQANGGYIILQINDVLMNTLSWELLKRVLKTRKLVIENLKEQLGLVAVSTLKPEPIPLDIKVVLVGNEMLYQLLFEYDEDFSKLFKIKVDFDYEMKRDKENVEKIPHFISSYCRSGKLLHFDRGGVASVVDYSSRLAEDQGRMTARTGDIAEILCEASVWAESEKCRLVSAGHVKKAIEEKRMRSDKYDRKISEMLEEGTIMIDTEGEAVGQINALSILDMGDYSFGKPSRITAATYVGKNGIVNIEREAEMSGTTHTKGILILSGYIGQKYAQDMPLSLTASLCFEQLYGGIDGDSASSAELYAIMSSLSEIPLKQYIAVTGSVNQKGEIQPIGGAIEKIEGFFELCEIRGLTGRQGVIIPHQNVRNLMLSDKVTEAVRTGMFHIYPVSTIDEGIEILTGVEAGTERKADGAFKDGTINGLVCKKLHKFAKISEGKDLKAEKTERNDGHKTEKSETHKPEANDGPQD